jgi:peptide/nickel transport system substrate-binding protein
VDDGINRRAAAAIVLAFAAAALGSCASLPDARPAAGQPEVLRYAQTDEPDTLNPLLSTKAVSADVGYLAFSYFFNVDDHGAFVPEIATVVPTTENGGISRDGKVITYHLRPGVKWQDGTRLTARDVEYTFKAVMNPKNDVQSRVGYDQIARLGTPDDRTVVLHMRKPFSPIIAVFMGVQGGTPILPAHLLPSDGVLTGVTYNSRPVGSGPFKITRWDKGASIEFDANAAYWRGPPRLAKIVFRKVADAAGALDKLRRGEVDAWFRAEPTNYRELSGLTDYAVTLSPENVIDHIDFNTRDPILQDVRVRRAIKFAIDRDRLIREITGGIYQKTDSDQQFFSWAYDATVPKMRYDPAAARRLLDEAGWTPGPDGILQRNGQRLVLSFAFISGQGTGSQVAAALRDQLRSVGIAMTIRPLAETSMFNSARNGGLLNSGKYQMAYFGWVFDVDPDDSSQYACDQMPPTGQNSLFWCDMTLDAAEADALSSFDLARRKRDYAIVQRELATQVPTIFLFAERSIDVYSKRFTAFRPSPGESSFWNAWQWSVR